MNESDLFLVLIAIIALSFLVAFIIILFAIISVCWLEANP